MFFARRIEGTEASLHEAEVRTETSIPVISPCGLLCDSSRRWYAEYGHRTATFQGWSNKSVQYMFESWDHHRCCFYQKRSPFQGRFMVPIRAYNVTHSVPEVSLLILVETIREHTLAPSCRNNVEETGRQRPVPVIGRRWPFVGL